MKELHFNFTERLTLLNMLPQRGTRVMMVLVRDLTKKLDFTVEEVSAASMKDNPDGTVQWNEAAETVLAVEFTMEQISMLKEFVETLTSVSVKELDMIERIEAL